LGPAFFDGENVLKAVSSVSNPMVKRLRALSARKGRQAEGAFLLEGTKLLAEALQSGQHIECVMASDAWWQAHGATLRLGETGAVCFNVSEAVLEAIATTRTPDPVVAMVRLPQPVYPQWQAGEWIVIAHQLQDPGNLGTIIRAADASGALMVVVTDDSVDPFSPKVVRASMGSLFHLPVVRLSMPAFRAHYAACPIYALVLDGDAALYDCDLRAGGAFLVGNEGSGLPPAERQLSTRRVSIPMPGQSESLNAAMAATVCLFEAVRQKRAGAKVC
jgi:TrmH family RNA methyltransferase